MAQVLVSSVIADFRIGFPDCASADALTLFNRVHSDLLEAIPFKVTNEDISLTSGTYAYSINELTLKIWTYDYLTSATQGRRLVEYEHEAYNRDHPNWKLTPSGTPSSVSLWRSGSETTLFVHPIPNVTTSGGYPIIRCEVSRSESLATSDYTPKGLGSVDVYITGMAKRYARYRKRDEYAFWSAQYQEELDRELKTWQRRSVETKPQLIPNWMPRIDVA